MALKHRNSIFGALNLYRPTFHMRGKSYADEQGDKKSVKITRSSRIYEFR